MDRLIKIFELFAEEADQIASRPDQPHQHDFEELLIGTEGSLEHFIDFRYEEIQAPYLCFVTKGKVHRVIPRAVNGKCHVWGIRFRSEFIAETTFHLYQFFHDNANLALEGGRCFDRLVQICQMMQDELKQQDPDLGVVKHLLSALFVMIESDHQRKQGESEPGPSQGTTFSHFLKILEEHFRTDAGVEFYAGQLFMTSRNLNQITQKMVQQSVSEMIETRKLIEAKNLLTSTDQSISEIAFTLGYKEKSYFSKVFKKKSGQTPSEFREEMKRLV